MCNSENLGGQHVIFYRSKRADEINRPLFCAVERHFPFFPYIDCAIRRRTPVINKVILSRLNWRVTMDDDVIDVSNIPYDQYKKHMRELSEKAVCPCNNCDPVCDRASTKSICERYQAWIKLTIGGN